MGHSIFLYPILFFLSPTLAWVEKTFKLYNKNQDASLWEYLTRITRILQPHWTALPSNIHIKAWIGFSTEGKLYKWFPDVVSWLPASQLAIHQTKDSFKSENAHLTHPLWQEMRRVANTDHFFSLETIGSEWRGPSHEYHFCYALHTSKQNSPEACWGGVLGVRLIYLKCFRIFFFNTKDNSVESWPLFLQCFLCLS